jgi:SpoVK/Ycf46/Vps4 family AAA+-type ATPase
MRDLGKELSESLNMNKNTYIEDASSTPPNKELNNVDGYCQWLKIKGNTYVPSLKTILKDKLEAGVYKLKYDHQMDEVVYQKKTISLDELLYLPNKIFDEIIEDINYFWNNKEKFVKYKFTYKRGILLHGRPGCGKSSICLLLSNEIINRGGIVIYINNAEDLTNFNESISKFRSIQPDTPILCIIEDLDGLSKFPEIETSLLNLLDGVNQLDNIVYVGNTNYPEQLKERITNRPSRFDRRYKIDIPNEEVRRYYFDKKIKDSDKKNIDVDYLTSKTEGLTLAHLGEVVKSIFIFNKNIDESIEEIKSMSEYISSTQYSNNKSAGFKR